MAAEMPLEWAEEWVRGYVGAAREFGVEYHRTPELAVFLDEYDRMRAALDQASDCPECSASAVVLPHECQVP